MKGPKNSIALALPFLALQFAAAQTDDGCRRTEEFIASRIAAGERADLTRCSERPVLAPGFVKRLLTQEGALEVVPKWSGIRISGIAIDEPLDLEGVILPFRFDIENSIFASPVSLQGAVSNDSVSFAGSRFRAELDMDGIEISRDLSLRKASLGSTTIRNADIGGHLDLSESLVNRLLDLSRTRVDRYLILDKSRHAPGKRSNLHGMRVGEVLSFRGAELFRLLQLRSVQTGLSLSLRDAQTTGQIVLHSATIGTNLTLTGGRFADINLTGAIIGGELRLQSGEHDAASWWSAAELNLRNARTQFFQDPTLLDAWPKELNLLGFRYELIGGYAASGDYDRPEALVSWLSRHRKYAPQPYGQLTDVLRTMGYDSAARSVAYAGKERARAQATGLRWLNLTMQWLLLGYGHAYWLSVTWVVVLTAIGASLIGTDPMGKTMNWLERILFSFDRLLPFVKLDSTNYASEPAPPARYYFYFHTLMGFVVAGYLAAAIV